MKQRILKALANPPRIFYVPYSLAVANFALQFLIFITIFITDLIMFGFAGNINPLYFLISVIIVHMLLVTVAKNEPQLGQIIAAKIKLNKSHIPRNIQA